jgi:hypothetical protein
MSTSRAISDLAACLEAIETAGYDVTEITGSAKENGSNRAQATIGLALRIESRINLPEEATLTIKDAEPAEEGVIDVGLQLEIDEPLGESPGEDGNLEADGSGRTESPRVEAADHGTAMTEVSESDAGTGDSTVEESGEGAASTAESEEADHGDDGQRSAESRPAYRDPDELRAVYDPERTFPEMTDDLGVDVTAQTVRKYMIEYGIHDPTPQPEQDANTGAAQSEGISDAADDDSGSDADEPSDSVASSGTNSASDTAANVTSEQVETATAASGGTEDHGETESIDRSAEVIPDGIDCPTDLTIEEIKQTVRTAQTPYEVQRELGLDRGTTQQLLSALDLLDLVRTRMDQAETDTSLETIETRIANATSD